MIDLDTELTNALAHRANGISVHRDSAAIERDAAATGPRPESEPGPTTTPSRWRRPLLVAAALATAVAAGSVILDIGDGGGSTAWAGWTAEAQPTTPADIAAIGDACTAALSAADPVDPGNPSADPGAVVATDVRGRGGYVLYDTGLTCAAERPDGGDFAVRATTTSAEVNDYATAIDEVGAERDVIGRLAAVSTDPANSFAWGVASPDVTNVVLNTPLGPVEASVDGQVWSAWWPDASGFEVTIEATDASGAVVFTADLADLLV